jgi:hypothetical protein
MIKIFRNIRQNLLSEGKTSKYFKYAIGEIFLVVIGILIALQINNWNENRKQNDNLSSIYQIIKEDLTIDIAEIDVFIEEFETVREPAFEAVLNTNPSKEEWLKHPEYRSVLEGFKDFTINQRGFEMLKSQLNSTIIAKQNLASKINLFYNQHLVEINVANYEIMREFENNMNERKQSPWLANFILNKDIKEAVEYIVDDPIEKNRIALYYIVYRIYVKELQKFKINGEAIIKEIDAFN